MRNILILAGLLLVLMFYVSKSLFSSTPQVVDVATEVARQLEEIKASKARSFTGRVEQFNTWLQEKNYSELNAAYQAAEQEVKENPEMEYISWAFIKVFSSKVADLEDEVKAWITAEPNNALPYLVAAMYYYDQGWKFRGGDFISEVPEKNLISFKNSLKTATDYAKQAIQLAPDNPDAYNLYIRSQCSVGGEKCVIENIDYILENMPQGLYPHLGILNFLAPKWGGEPAYKSNFLYLQALEEAGIFEKYPYLKPIQSYPYTEMAAQLIIYERKTEADTDDYKKAQQLLDTAKNFGELYYPISRSLYANQVKIFSKQGKTDQAQALFEDYFERFNGYVDFSEKDPYILNIRKNIVVSVLAGNYAETVKACDVLLKYLPWNEDSLQNKAYALAMIAQQNRSAQNLQNAEIAYRVAADLYPGNIKIIRVLTRILAARGNAEDAAVYWDNFIALEPDNAIAYWLRGRNYLRLNDKSSAKSNMQRSCDLGEKRACEQLNTL